MKIYVNVTALEGIEVEGVKVALGDDKQTVRAALGEPCDDYEQSFYFFDNELRVDFGLDGTAEFIEFLGGIDGVVQPVMWGMRIFEEDAQTVCDMLLEKNGGSVTDDEDGYSYGYDNISVGLYRESVPADVEAWQEEAGDDIDDADLAEEKKRAFHWLTVGIGIKDYYGIEMQ